MDYLKGAADTIGYITVIIGAVIAGVKLYGEWKKAKNGQLCLLRNELLKIYYKYKNAEARLCQEMYKKV